MMGKDIVGLSLPVRIFEPRSTLERLLDVYKFAPIYLRRAYSVLTIYSPLIYF